MDIAGRVRNILLEPKAEWQAIASEPTSIETIYRDYVVYLAAILPVAAFIGLALLGPFGIFGTLLWAIASYILSLFVVYVVAVVVNRLAQVFDGRPDFLSAFKLTAYSMTAAWLAGIFALIPFIGVVGLLLSLYSIYLFYIGLPVLMRSPPQRSLIYTLAAVLAGVVVQMIIGSILHRLFLHL